MYDIKILGAYGAKSDKGGSSAFYLNEENIIDAGNILKPLKEQNAKIKNIWLTHSHLDHISDIAYILDNYYELRTETLTIWGLPETLLTLKKHFFNDEIWPDFSKIPLNNNSGMSIKYAPLTLNKAYIIGNLTIEAFPTDHTVKSCGYIITSQKKSILITADTHTLTTMIENVNTHFNIHTIVVECSFPSAMEKLAIDSKHLTASLLFKNLTPLENKGLRLCINHLKPTYEKIISAEIIDKKGEWDVTILKDGDSIEF